MTTFEILFCAALTILGVFMLVVLAWVSWATWWDKTDDPNYDE